TSTAGESGWYFTANVGSTRYHYVYSLMDGWEAPFSIPDNASFRAITQAYVNGVDYLFTLQDGLFSSGPGFASKVSYTVQGLSTGSMQGVANAMNSLIFYTYDTLYWSAPDAPLEFRPVVSDVI